MYRESPAPLNTVMINADGTAFITANNPPVDLPGMAGVRLTVDGRLWELSVLPLTRTPAEASGPGDAVWGKLFTAAGLDMAAFRPVTPTVVPPGGCDRRLAWVGPHPDDPGREVRVEAAACGGRPTFFRLSDGIGGAGRSVPTPPWGVLVIIVLLAVAAALAAWNYARCRADLRGAFLPGSASFVISVVAWLAGRHTGSLSGDFGEFRCVVAFGGYLLAAGAIWYVAFEPFVRRRWAWRLTAWNRLLAGRWADPLVGRDLLIGITCGAGLLLLILGLNVAAVAAGEHFPIPSSVKYSLRTEYVVGRFMVVPRGPVVTLFFAFVGYLVFRREWLYWPAVAVFIAWGTAGEMVSLGSTALAAVETLSAGTLLVILLARFGILAAAGIWMSYGTFPLAVTLDPSVWYFRAGVV